MFNITPLFFFIKDACRTKGRKIGGCAAALLLLLFSVRASAGALQPEAPVAMWAVGAITVLLVSLGGLAAYAYRKTGRLQQTIKQQKDQIAGQAGEVHHQVKNSLQVLSSAMELALLKPDPDAKQIVQDAQIKMHAIALAHDMAFSSAGKEAVAAQDYFQQLGDYVLNVCGIKPGDMEIHVALPGIQFGIDDLLPLSLAFTEMLANTIKWGRATSGITRVNMAGNRQNGALTIRFSDNGPGFPSYVNYKEPKTSGLRLLYRLAGQAGAELRIGAGDAPRLEYAYIFTAPTGAYEHTNT